MTEIDKEILKRKFLCSIEEGVRDSNKFNEIIAKDKLFPL